MRYFVNITNWDYYVTDDDMSKVDPNIVECSERPDHNFTYNVNTKTWEANLELTLSDIRDKREKLLNETDWTQLVDSPLSEDLRERFRLYRQALRDLPSQTTDPLNVVWPETPNIN